MPIMSLKFELNGCLPTQTRRNVNIMCMVKNMEEKKKINYLTHTQTHMHVHA